MSLHLDFRHQGILGNANTDRLVEDALMGGTPVVFPTFSGTSWIRGINMIMLDHDDPLPEGFVVGDIWA